MKQSKQHLDEFFAAARSEEPVITQENARDLLSQKSLVQHSTSFITKKGLVMTSVLGLTAAGVIALSVGAFSSNDAPLGSQTAQPPISSANTLPRQMAASPLGQYRMNPSDESITSAPKTIPTKEPAVPPHPPVPAFPPKAIDEVKVVPIDESKFAKLGIEKESDGGIAFFIKSLGHKFEKYILPVTTWGVMIPSKSTITESELPVSSHLTPALITDARGNRRMLFMSDSNSTISMNHSYSLNKNANGETYKETKTTMLAPHDDTAHVKLISIQKEEQIDNDNEVIDDAEIPGHQPVPADRHELIDSAAMRQLQETLRSLTDPKQYDEVMNDLKVLKKYNPKQKFEITIGEDTAQMNKIRKQAEMNFRIVKELRSRDEQANNSATTKRHGDTIAYHINNGASIIIPGQTNIVVKAIHNTEGPDIEHVLINGQSLSDMVNEQIKRFDNLVPVLVRTATTTTHNPHDNVDYDNGVIFWFAETPELDEIVGKTASANTPAAISSINISNVTVFPNPAKTDATVHFTLSGEHSITLTLYDILGKRIADLGSFADLASGDHEEKLFVGNVPPGIYLLAVTTAEGEQRIERIVIDR
ncbi:MAG TPA: T9SS type A sorting domain-containing protein [Candidatus Kapabacteria bacterium]|nr:T9SS type A sorting domain-containing protein [Candidatus Kapabacteria bacterium]